MSAHETLRQRVETELYNLLDGPHTKEAKDATLDRILSLVGEESGQASRLEEALIMLGSDYPDRQLCWCDMRIGNPMVHEHSRACLAARAALATAPRSPASEGKISVKDLYGFQRSAFVEGAEFAINKHEAGEEFERNWAYKEASAIYPGPVVPLTEKEDK